MYVFKTLVTQYRLFLKSMVEAISDRIIWHGNNLNFFWIIFSFHQDCAHIHNGEQMGLVFAAHMANAGEQPVLVPDVLLHGVQVCKDEMDMRDMPH